MKVFLKYSTSSVNVGSAIINGGFSVYSGSINLGQITHTNLINGIIIDNVPIGVDSLTLLSLDPDCNGATFDVILLYPVNSMQLTRTNNTTLRMRLTFELPSHLGITGIKNVTNNNSPISASVVWENSNSSVVPGYSSGVGTMTQSNAALDTSLANRLSYESKSYTSFNGTVSSTTSVINSKYVTLSNTTLIDTNNSYIHNGVATVFVVFTNSTYAPLYFAQFMVKDFRIRCNSSVYSGAKDSFTMNYANTKSFISGGDGNRNVTFNAYDIKVGTIRPCSYFYIFN